MRIDSVDDFKSALEQGPYAWPGGYPCYFVCADGGALSYTSASENAALIAAAIRDGGDDQWRVVGFDVNWEDMDLVCADTGQRIESAYGESEAQEG